MAHHFEISQSQRTENPAVPVAVETMPSEIDALLAKAKRMLQDDQPNQALKLLTGAKRHTPDVANAIGVCLLRLGRWHDAVNAFRAIVLGTGGVVLRSDVPVHYLINYATALLADSNLDGCDIVLSEICQEKHPAIQRLRRTINQWKRSLTFRQRLSWWTGGHPRRSITFDFPPGELG